MALRTDDCDIREVYMQTMLGGNGDYYITLYEFPKDNEQFKMINYRMAMSGGFAKNHPRVKEAFVELYRAMEEAGMNNHPQDD